MAPCPISANRRHRHRQAGHVAVLRCAPGYVGDDEYCGSANPEIIRVKVIVLSTRKLEARFQSAAVAIGERERPAKRAGKLLGDGKAKPGATGFAIARSLDTIKRQEYRLQMLVGNTGPPVRYGDRDAVRPLRIDSDFDILAEFQPVIDQVDHDAAQGLRVRENRHPAFSGKAKKFSGVGIVADEAIDKGMQVGLAPLLADLVAPAGQGKTLLDERLHFLQVALQFFPGVARHPGNQRAAACA